MLDSIGSGLVGSDLVDHEATQRFSSILFCISRSVLSACSSCQTACYEGLAYDNIEDASLHFDWIVGSVKAMSMTLNLIFRL